MEMIAKAFPYTVVLTLLCVTLGTVIGLLVGIITAVRRGTWIDF